MDTEMDTETEWPIVGAKKSSQKVKYTTDTNMDFKGKPVRILPLKVRVDLWITTIGSSVSKYILWSICLCTLQFTQKQKALPTSTIPKQIDLSLWSSFTTEYTFGFVPESGLSPNSSKTPTFRLSPVGGGTAAAPAGDSGMASSCRRARSGSSSGMKDKAWRDRRWNNLRCTV